MICCLIPVYVSLPASSDSVNLCLSSDYLMNFLFKDNNSVYNRVVAVAMKYKSKKGTSS